MKATDDLVVTLRLRDEFTPAVRRLGRRMWWYQHGQAVSALCLMAGIVIGAVLVAAVR